MKIFLAPMIGVSVLATAAADTTAVATGINQFGLELHRRLAADGGNLVVSPWSIETALAMTYAGSAGKTQKEMAAVLHFPDAETKVHAGFAAIAADLDRLEKQSEEQVKLAKPHGGEASPLEIHTANRLFGQKDYPFEKPFIDLTARTYGAPLERLDFATDPEDARKTINRWVETATRDKIRELLPPQVIDPDTSLVLTNAIYFKAPWAEAFNEEPEGEFRVHGKEPVKVPTLTRRGRFGYAEIPGGVAVAVPYAGGGLRFVLIVPSAADGLAAMEKSLTAAHLSQIAAAPARDIILHFPAFKLEPDRVMLADNLIAMGMPTAFDRPQGSADFSRMGPRTPDDYLFISHVVHKAFIAVDKYGTEAAAATAVIMPRMTAQIDPAKPLEILVDRPFVFAIQHQSSGACLFLGRVTDPR